jgi:hypothetical protein
MIADWYLNTFEGFDQLKQISQKDAEGWQEACQAFDFSNRGIMGDYWEDMQQSTLAPKKESRCLFQRLWKRLFRSPC